MVNPSLVLVSMNSGGYLEQSASGSEIKPEDVVPEQPFVDVVAVTEDFSRSKV